MTHQLHILHVHSTSEPSSIRLIRTACKAFERRGDEKRGCPLQFTAHLKKEGFEKKSINSISEVIGLM